MVTALLHHLEPKYRGDCNIYNIYTILSIGKLEEILTYEISNIPFPTCYAYSVKTPIGELNLKRALLESFNLILLTYMALFERCTIQLFPNGNTYITSHNLYNSKW